MISRERIARVAMAGSIGLTMVGWLGLLVGDEISAGAVLLYLPTGAVGLLAVGLAACSRRWKWAAAVGALAIGAVVWDAVEMRGIGEVVPGQGLDVVQWNVQWGGGLKRSPEAWAEMTAGLEHDEPGLIVLNEAPEVPWVAALATRLGPGWTFEVIENGPGEGYWYRMAVMVRGRVVSTRRVPLVNGVGMDARVETGEGPLKVLAVDGESRPWLWKGPFLESVAGELTRADREGEAYDVVLGDFNARERCRSFARVEASGPGYWDSLEQVKGWKGTWPLPAPWLDLDHLLVRRDWSVRRAGLFRGSLGDHRGIRVRLGRPGRR